MKLFSLLLIFFIFADNGLAATLPQLQDMAIKNRKIIESYKANQEKSAEDINIARSRYLPSFDVSYTMNRLGHSTQYESRENSAAYAGITYNLFAGFRDKYTIESSRLLKEVEDKKLAALHQDIKLNVALGYLRIYNSQANLQVVEDFYNNIAKTHADAESRYEVGLIKKNDLLKFKVDLDNAAINLEKARTEVSKNLSLLAREIDSEISLDQLLFEEFKELPGTLDIDQYEEDMLKNRSEIMVLDDLLLAAQAREKVEYASRYPKLDLASSLVKRDDNFIINNSEDNSEEFRTQLVLSMNLFDGDAKNAKLRKAKQDAKSIGYQLHELKRGLQTTLANLFMDLEVGRKNATVAESSIVQAEENLRVNRLSYQEGVSTESDLLDAIANLSRAKYNHVAAKSDVFDSYFRITREVEGF